MTKLAKSILIVLGVGIFAFLLFGNAHAALRAFSCEDFALGVFYCADNNQSSATVWCVSCSGGESCLDSRASLECIEDTTAPTVDNVSHSPDPVDPGDSVTYSVSCSDNIDVEWCGIAVDEDGDGVLGALDGEPEKVCSGSTCSVTGGGYAAGQLIAYRGEAWDFWGLLTTTLNMGGFTVTGGGAGGILKVTPIFHDFGTIPTDGAGGAEGTQDFLVENTGTGPTGPGQLDSIGNPHFDGGNVCVYSLDAGKSKTCVITFDPLLSGDQSTTATFRSGVNDVVVDLKGFGGPPGGFTVTPSIGISFNDVTIGSSPSRDFDIKNNGSVDITVDIAELADPFFAYSLNTISLDIAAGKTESVTVTYDPPGQGPHTAGYEFTSSSGPDVIRTVDGKGVVGGSGFTVSPPDISFGSHAVGTSPIDSFAIENLESGPITVNIAEIGDLDDAFRPEYKSIVLLGREIRSLDITFTPPGTLTYSVDYIFTSFDVSTNLSRRVDGTGVSGGGACNNDGTCDAGETTASCSSDCPLPPPSVTIKFGNPLGVGTLPEVIEKVADFLFTVALIIAPILLVVAGVIFMTAAGDPGRISSARRMLIWTIVGFAIILLSKGLITVLKGILGAP